jgi:hypothetical protein
MNPYNLIMSHMVVSIPGDCPFWTVPDNWTVDGHRCEATLHPPQPPSGTTSGESQGTTRNLDHAHESGSPPLLLRLSQYGLDILLAKLSAKPSAQAQAKRRLKAAAFLTLPS